MQTGDAVSNDRKVGKAILHPARGHGPGFGIWESGMRTSRPFMKLVVGVFIFQLQVSLATDLSLYIEMLQSWMSPWVISITVWEQMKGTSCPVQDNAKCNSGRTKQFVRWSSKTTLVISLPSMLQFIYYAYMEYERTVYCYAVLMSPKYSKRKMIHVLA